MTQPRNPSLLGDFIDRLNWGIEADSGPPKAFLGSIASLPSSLTVGYRVSRTKVPGTGVPDWWIIKTVGNRKRFLIRTTRNSFERWRVVMSSQGWKCVIGDAHYHLRTRRCHLKVFRTCDGCGGRLAWTFDHAVTLGREDASQRKKELHHGEDRQFMERL